MLDEVEKLRIEEVHDAMVEIGYRPTGNAGETASDYALRFIEEIENLDFHIGAPDKSTTAALVYTIEAARCMCGMPRPELAIRLLQMAIQAVEKGDRLAIKLD